MGLPTADTLRHIFPDRAQQDPPTFTPDAQGQLQAPPGWTARTPCLLRVGPRQAPCTTCMRGAEQCLAACLGWSRAEPAQPGASGTRPGAAV